MAKVSLEKDKIKFLLVEGVHQKALDSLRAAGYTNIEFHKGALDTEQLKESIRDASSPVCCSSQIRSGASSGSTCITLRS
jgi:phosphoglycerate dehydrogenase-like enzyme